MELVMRCAFLALFAMFIVNVGTAIRGLERDSLIEELQTDLGKVRAELRNEIAARMQREGLINQELDGRQVALAKQLHWMRDVDQKLESQLSSIIASNGLRIDSPADLLQQSVPDPEKPYDRKRLALYLQEAKSVISQASTRPWFQKSSFTKFERKLHNDLIRFQNRTELLPLDDIEHLLTSYIRLKLHAFQQLDPVSCPDAPQLVCKISKSCGFGCQLHHLTDCLIVSQYAGRTMIIDESNWLYDDAPDDPAPHSSHGGWNYFFHPVSTCTFVNSVGADQLPQYLDADDVVVSPRLVHLPLIESRYAAKWAIYYVPPELKPLIKIFHKDPPVWYTGQMIAYLIRINADTQRYISALRSSLNFTQPCVGMHIRRSDKLQVEASFHALDEYLTAARRMIKDRRHLQAPPYPEEGTILSMRREIELQLGFDSFWHSLSPTNRNFSSELDTRFTLYVATDDQEERDRLQVANFTDFRAVSNPIPQKRYTRLSLVNLLADIYLLSECETFVGTFSSQISRVVFELSQTLWRPTIERLTFATSLDEGWYYSG